MRLRLLPWVSAVMVSVSFLVDVITHYCVC